MRESQQRTEWQPHQSYGRGMMDSMFILAQAFLLTITIVIGYIGVEVLSVLWGAANCL